MSKHTKVTNMHGQGIVVVDALTGRTVADDDRIVACVNALAGVDDPAAFVAEAHRLAATVGAAMSCGTLTIDARWRIHRAIQSFSATKETK